MLSLQFVPTYITATKQFQQAAYNFEAGDPLPTFVISLYKSLVNQLVSVHQEYTAGGLAGMTYEVRKSA